jgi:hypothetical protein
VPESFSWVDHRLVRDRHVQRCGTYALALYLVLVTVGDADGVSFYRDETLCVMLRWSRIQLKSARTELIEVGLLAFDRPFYQVLGLDPAAPQPREPAERAPRRSPYGDGPPATPDEVAAIIARMKREAC